MVIADWFEKKYVEPLKQRRREEAEQRLEAARQASREEGLEKGRAEANARWREWNHRRLLAEARGETFDDPLPDSDD